MKISNPLSIIPLLAALLGSTLSEAQNYVIGPDGITAFYGNYRNGSAIGPHGVTTWNNGPTGGTIIGPEGTTVWSGSPNQITVSGPGGTSLWSSSTGIRIAPSVGCGE